MDLQRDNFFLKASQESNNQKGDKLKSFNKNFKKNSNTKEGPVVDKKPFDKKTYRLKKYSKKYKLEKWEEQHKKQLLHNYYKEVQQSETSGTYKPKTFDENDENDSVGKFVRHPDLLEKEEKQAPKNAFTKAKERFERVKLQKNLKREELEKVKEEKRQKLKEYKQKKAERFKKLSRKNKKGQPVMTGRLELLLDKIQKTKT